MKKAVLFPAMLGLGLLVVLAVFLAVKWFAPANMDLATRDAMGTSGSADVGAVVASSDAIGEGGDGGDGGGPEGAARHMQETSLKAGAVDDNSQWDDYLSYLGRNAQMPAHRVDVSERYIITVLDAAGLSVHGVEVSIKYDGVQVWSGRTYADGRMLWMPGMVDGLLEAADGMATVGVVVDGVRVEEAFSMDEGADAEWELRLDSNWVPDSPVALDVVYLVDATGSMSDEIELLKETLAWVAEEIEGGDMPVDLRMGMVAYRDRGEEFVTEVYELDRDVAVLRRDVRSLSAEGGGDTRESLNEGLHEAVSGMNWRVDAAVKLVFLVADAGPHLDYEQDWDYSIEMRKALADGVKVHAVATSGLDAFGEYVFRQVAQHTMGKFIFLVYGGATTHDVGDQFTEDELDQLIVDLVLSEVQHLER